ncbi:TPA: hypothetical protein WII62_001779 [Neisseria meningitidis]
MVVVTPKTQHLQYTESNGIAIKTVHRRTSFDSCRATAGKKSRFDVESGANFDKTVELPIEDGDGKIGVVAEPSGSGKTGIGKARELYAPTCAGGKPIADEIAPDKAFHEVTAALSAAGLGSVPVRLRPYTPRHESSACRRDGRIARMAGYRHRHTVFKHPQRNAVPRRKPL